MLYIIDNKYYVNISPLMYVEVNISDDGNIVPTDNKIEVSSNIKVQSTTLEDVLKNNKKTEMFHEYNENEILPKYNRRKK